MGQRSPKINTKEFTKKVTANSDILKSKTRSLTKDINLDKLIPFKNHPFKLYEGQQLKEMVESIRANGVIVPIIVRPSNENEQYEVLSGHNRVNAAKEAGLNFVPAVIRDELTDEEALLIVTETNLLQRSFTDLKPSERAAVLAVHYEAMKKKPGYRSDLLEEIEELFGAPVGHRMKTRDKISEAYGLSKTTISRYLRINKLIPELKNQLDEGKIRMRAAESLSFLENVEQELIAELIADGKKINMKQAETLKKQSADGKLAKEDIISICNSDIINPQTEILKLKCKDFSKYFKPEQGNEEIERIINEALEMYFSAGSKKD